MESQDEMAFPEFNDTAPASELYRPIEGKQDPLIWIEEVAVYRSWPPGPTTEMRRIKLHRGLNILWADPAGRGRDGGRLSGHGAGKTTFCRLLRHVLAYEETPGTKDFVDAFNGTAGDGWVLAQIWVANKRWLVGRPMGRASYQSFALLDGTLDQAFPRNPMAKGFREYQDAIDAAMFSGMDDAVFGPGQPRTLPDSNKKLQWAHVLAWLSRDQECHFGGLVDWRSEDSEHGSPKTSSDDRHNILRLALGLINRQEQAMVAEAATAAGEHEAEIKKRGLFEFARDEARQALCTKLGLAPEAVPTLELLKPLAQAQAAAWRAEAGETAQDPELEQLKRAVTNAQEAWDIEDGRIANIEHEIKKMEAVKANLPMPVPNPRVVRYRELWKRFGPVEGLCSHPTDDEYFKSCPFAPRRKTIDVVDAATHEISNRADGSEYEILAMEKEIGELRKRAEPTRLLLVDAKRDLEAAELVRKPAIDRRANLMAEAVRLDTLLSEAEKKEKALTDSQQKLAQLEARKKELAAKLKAMAVQHRQTLNTFSRLYRHIVKHLLGSAVNGRITIGTRAIEVELEWHGKRRSAALNVVKYAAFDLAALALGRTTASCWHPGILIHDSPREADLAKDIYTSLFTAAREMEPDEGQAAFQYVVTTTEPPPEALRADQWLLKPVLDASREEGRLLGVNL